MGRFGVRVSGQRPPWPAEQQPTMVGHLRPVMVASVNPAFFVPILWVISQQRVNVMGEISVKWRKWDRPGSKWQVGPDPGRTKSWWNMQGFSEGWRDLSRLSFLHGTSHIGDSLLGKNKVLWGSCFVWIYGSCCHWTHDQCLGLTGFSCCGWKADLWWWCWVVVGGCFLAWLEAFKIKGLLEIWFGCF